MKWTLGIVGTIVAGSVFGVPHEAGPNVSEISAELMPDAVGSEVAVDAPAVAPPGLSDWPTPADSALSREQIVAGAEGSVALIRGKLSSGSGFLIRPGVLVTNAHVIRQEFVQNIRVHFPSADGRRHGPFTADLRAEDEGRDLAFLAVATDLKPLPLDESYQFVRGQDVTLIGNPGLGGDSVLPNAINRGVMSTLTLINGRKYYQIGMSINPGDSGGPLLNAGGKVVGIATLRAAKQEGLGFGIPVEDVRAAIDRLANPTADQLAETRSRHRAKALVRSLHLLGGLYGQGLDQCTNAWQTALERRADPDAVLAVVSQALTEKLRAFTKKSFIELRREWDRVTTDPRINAAAREDLARLWSGVGQMRSYIEKPRGDFASYALKVRELKQSQTRLFERLKRETGIVIE